MISKSFKNIVLSVAIIASFNSIAGVNTGETYTQTEETQWIFVERMFKVEPGFPVFSQKLNFMTAGITLAAAYLAYFKVDWKAWNKADGDMTANITTRDLGKIAIPAAAASYVYHNYIVPKTELKSAQDTVVKFVKNWNEYKAYTPAEFHDLFDRLATEDEATLRKIAFEVVKTIQHHLKHHFEKHYYYASHSSSSSKAINALNTFTEAFGDLKDLL